MPRKASTFEAGMRELEAAVEQSKGAAPGSHEERQRMALESTIAQINTLKARKERVVAELARTTRRKNEAVQAGRYVATGLRAMIRSILGPRDIRLKVYGIAPLRGPGRRRPIS